MRSKICPSNLVARGHWEKSFTGESTPKPEWIRQKSKEEMRRHVQAIFFKCVELTEAFFKKWNMLERCFPNFSLEESSLFLPHVYPILKLFLKINSLLT